MATTRTRILTDSAADLPPDLCRRLGIGVIPLTVHFGQETLRDGVDLTNGEFYRRLTGGGELPHTSQIDPATYANAFQEALATADEVVYVGLSSGLSGSMQSAHLALEMAGVGERVHLVDSLGASMGQGLMALVAAQRAAEGAGAWEIASYLQELRLQVRHVFTLDTLEYLRRGGRISGFAAAAGQLLDIKPLLRMDEEGKIVPLDRLRGRRRALRRLLEEVEAGDGPVAGRWFGISHAQAPQEAAEFAAALAERYPQAEVVVGEIGATIGTHVGPGCLALFFASARGR